MSSKEFKVMLMEMSVGEILTFKREGAILKVQKRENSVGWTHGSVWYDEDIGEFAKMAGDGWKV